MRIAIIGTGYVGLVSGACFAEMGIEVACVDNDAAKIERLRRGVIPIYEPGLEDIVSRNAAAGRLHFHTSVAEGVDGAQVVFIAVGTPPDEDGGADLSHVLAAARQIGRAMTGPLVVAVKSTVPVGTSDKVRAAIEEAIAERDMEAPDFDIASNPEFLKEGNAVEDFMRPDRVVVGVDSEHARAVMDRLYKPFMVNSYRVIFTDTRSAEMIKYAANAMLATRISFMNDIAGLCELVGADVNMVRRGMGSDPRIGSKFLYPGIGYGGSCFPKDVRALIRTAGENDCRLEILEAVENINARQKEVLARKVERIFGSGLSGRVFAVWGLAFKPETDDVRESPALVTVRRLVAAGATVRVYDPVAMATARVELKETDASGGSGIRSGGVRWCETMYDALEGADALLLTTEWKQFRMPDWERVAAAMRGREIFDGRNVYDATEIRAKGFNYHGIGVK